MESPRVHTSLMIALSKSLINFILFALLSQPDDRSLWQKLTHFSQNRRVFEKVSQIYFNATYTESKSFIIIVFRFSSLHINPLHQTSTLINPPYQPRISNLHITFLYRCITSATHANLSF